MSSRYKFELKYGDPSAPLKIICFISTMCIDCANFMIGDLGSIKSFANTGKFEVGFFPYLLSDADEMVFTSLVSSGVNQEQAYLNHAQFRRVHKRDDKNEYVSKLLSKPAGLMFPIRPRSKVPNNKRIRANLSAVHLAGEAGWGISTAPASVVNGLVMRRPHKGKLLSEMSRLSKLV